MNTDAESAQITGGILQRTLSLRDGSVTTTGFFIAGHDCLAHPAQELTFTIYFAEPNQLPPGLSSSQGNLIETAAGSAAGTDSLQVKNPTTNESSAVAWVRKMEIRADNWSAQFDPSQARVLHSSKGIQKLQIASRARSQSELAGLQVVQSYEIYNGFPVIRKWVEISNHGNHWIKLNNLLIDNLELSDDRRHQTPLTPSERGARSSVIAFGAEDGSSGMIAVSEIPSALREMRDTGAMGYSDENFEWVLGPGETFVSEPVFWFAYDGPSVKTVSAVSTARDRAIEGSYLQFLRQHVGVAADHGKIAAPQWCSWSNFGWAINDAIIREQAAIAARCGFELLLLDSGWQKDKIGTEPDPRKFPDFDATCRYIHSQGLKLGLWVSCFRTADSPDLKTMPEMRSAPLIKRDGGFGMSFPSPWRKFYAADLARISKTYGVSYFKQDYTDIKFGDVAEAHESRTRQDSLLRGLRGLLEAQDLLHAQSPEVSLQITHEIYWGTPGVPCDVAVLKHAAAYHIPPNDYSGVGHTKQRVAESWSYDPQKLRQELVAGCFNARQRFYLHRGLPLYALEYYGAHAVNFHGSLTPEIQDRQVCSWLMGAPSVFAGDLASLSEANINHYKARFDLLRRLENDYDIYRHFQFSGVPAPTDTDWHWWGKLNENGTGAVVVIRGNGGNERRAVNIPWVKPAGEYEVTACLGEKSLGRFKGCDLQSGILQLELPPLGQEILELKLIP